jgi:hypothetical protein
MLEAITRCQPELAKSAMADIQLFQNPAEIFLLQLRGCPVDSAQISVTFTGVDLDTAGHLLDLILGVGHIFYPPECIEVTGDATFLIDPDSLGPKSYS